MRGVTPVPGAARVAGTANAGRDDAERNDGEAIASAQSRQIAATGNVIGRFHVRRLCEPERHKACQMRLRLAYPRNRIEPYSRP